MIRRWLVALTMTTLAFSAMESTPPSANDAEIVEIHKIWDEAPHNAFTDLVRFKGEWFCAFREGKAHVSPDGALRILASSDGKKWKSVARLTSSTSDLRDPKMSVTPEDRLMLIATGAMHQPATARHQSMVWLSGDGTTWDAGHAVGDPDFWLWRVTWHKETAYVVGYSTNPDRKARTIRLYRSRDGARFEAVATNIISKEFPGESTLRFLADDTALALLRRDGETFSAQLGTARPPYTEWKWKDLGKRIGGPNFIQLPDGRFVAATRLHDGAVRTALSWLDPQAGTLKEFLVLPSGGDCAYAGLVWHDDLLWVSYHSSHEGKTSIYLAKVRLPKA